MNHGGEGVSHHKKGHCGFPVKLNADTDCTVLNRRPFSMKSFMLMDCRWKVCHNPKNRTLWHQIVNDSIKGWDFQYANIDMYHVLIASDGYNLL